MSYNIVDENHFTVTIFHGPEGKMVQLSMHENDSTWAFQTMTYTDFENLLSKMRKATMKENEGE